MTLGFYFCPACGQELAPDETCSVCAGRVKYGHRKDIAVRNRAFPKAPTLNEDLQKYLSRNGITGDRREKGLAAMNALGKVGFQTSHCPWWLQWDSPDGERVFADFFFSSDIGKARLLWKDMGSEETLEAVLEICSGIGVSAYFPFAYKESTNGKKGESKAPEKT